MIIVFDQPNGAIHTDDDGVTRNLIRFMVT